MPAALEVDRQQVRLLVLTVGVREAAKQLGLSSATVGAWSARGKWLAQTKPQPALLPKPASMQPTNSANKTPVNALTDALADDNKATRHALSKALRKGAEHAADMQPGAILKQSRAVVDMAKGAGLVHEWNGSKPDGGLVNVTLVRLELPAMPDLKDAKVIEIESGE